MSYMPEIVPATAGMIITAPPIMATNANTRMATVTDRMKSGPTSSGSPFHSGGMNVKPETYADATAANISAMIAGPISMSPSVPFAEPMIAAGIAAKPRLSAAIQMPADFMLISGFPQFADHLTQRALKSAELRVAL